jgi:type III secretion system low calcium response chaperone LcrH/SycD
MDDTTNIPLNGEKIRGLIKTTVTKMGPHISKEEKKEHAKLLIKIFERGMTPQEAMGITDLDIREIYSLAYSLFVAGRHQEAREAFKLLLTLQPKEAGFSTSLGVCHHRLKNYEKAITCYMLSASLASQDPIPFFYAYDCYLNLNDKECAAIMLRSTIARAGDQPQYAKIKAKASMLLDGLEKELAKTPKDAKVDK